ncbi:MAG: potassium transporter Kup [Acidobacteria bacterium]|nr:potassium transporter Kup [Acidobacteriota bacterium]
MSLHNEKTKTGTFLLLSLEALGVVFGDIGTSLLYALKVCFSKGLNIQPTELNILGVLSLIFWALTLTVTIKYLLFILRADNSGEGGVLALMALCRGVGKKITFVSILGLFGAGLLYGDGVITPAISVLSAIEGLEVYAPNLATYVVPTTITVLVLLFLFQKKGTAGVGKVFGPIMVIWFISIGILGLNYVLKSPQILKAVNPYYGLNFFFRNGLHSLLILGAVFLAVTGAEALYADIGHFGKNAIRLNWFVLVFPSLFLNYFGQGALLLSKPNAVSNPFFNLAPSRLLIPFVVLSTMATVIASQAVISGAFSITRQAVQMGFLPRLPIIHTSSIERGQIYVPTINYLLMIITITLVFAFRTSDNLASAYGVAVTTTMLITTLLFYRLTTYIWKWNPFFTLFITFLFFVADISFFLANIVKVEKGGYLPLIIGLSVFFIMKTWKKGRTLLFERLQESTIDWAALIHSAENTNIARVPGTAIFLSGNPKGVPVALLHNLKHNKVLHENIITMTIVTTEEPKVKKKEDRLEVFEIAPHIYSLTAKYGFMETPDVNKLLDQLPSKGLSVDRNSMTFFLGRETLVPSRKKMLNRFEKFVFNFLSKNATSATAFFNLTPNKVVELGSLVEI